MPSRRLGFAMILNRPETIVEDTNVESLLVEEAPSTSDAHWLLSSLVSSKTPFPLQIYWAAPFRDLKTCWLT